MPSKLSRATVDFNSCGRIVDNLFFRIFPGPFFEEMGEDMPGILIREVDGGDPTEVSIESDVVRDESSGRCELHSDRKDIGLIESVHCMIANFGESDGDVFGHNSFEYLHVSKRLQRALLEANLSGLRFAANEIELDAPGPEYLKEIRTLCFDGRDIRRALTIKPESENFCRVCNHRPIVCPFCPTAEMSCPKCGETVGGTDFLVGEANDLMLHFAADPGDDAGPVLDFRAWDGCDFVGPSSVESIVTGRVVDIFLSLDIKNIGVQPLRCFVEDGCDDPHAFRSHLFPRELLQNPIVA